MNLYFLTRHNLSNDKFIHDFVHHFKQGEKAILLHDHFSDKIEDTRFVTKRISALLSENMIVNNALSGDQRGMFLAEREKILIRKELVNALFQNIQLLILNPIVTADKQIVAGNVEVIIKEIRSTFSISKFILFPKNMKSPLSANKETVAHDSDYQRLIAMYEEEKEILDMALNLKPAIIAAPVNFQS